MSLQQFDLFAPRPVLPGLRLGEEFVTPAEEAKLAARIDAAGLAPFRFQGWEGRRLTASFGYGYDFERGRVLDAPPIPPWLEPLKHRAAAFAGLDPEALRQALVIRYDPGAAIGWHRDRPQFGTVIGLSLGAPAVLRLRRRAAGGFERRALPLAPRSIYALSGEVRTEWEHSIVPQQATRWSITFRTLAAPAMPAR
ncbi:MAG TPA: alpha-ketoglutarate-dependent dioxygenase AlkB [Novosphingobium sp.]|nr:alpha-ketoglutarate-dependent dioxygenase AlkB [Novosphingobium sp.]